MNEFTASQVKIEGGFWGSRLQLNAEKAIYHQWEQLEKTGCIENFHLVAGVKEGVREGWFFADSDAYKWLDAASRIYASRPSIKLKSLMDDFIQLIGQTQAEDGYIFTYNQFHFPEVRWSNLQIEHELYCHGHLIEAGVSHFEATGEGALLDIVIKAADLLVRDFSAAGPEGTPGHEEIELALLRLYRVTQNEGYLKLAEHFIEQRGRLKPFLSHILPQNKSVEGRGMIVNERIKDYNTSHPERAESFQLAANNVINTPPWGKLRWLLNTATGKYFQQHKPIRQQTVPVGHSVRFTYLETAIAMLYQHHHDESLLTTLEKAWDHMVKRRMYLTGGIGALPNIEGFGRDYELDPVYSYSETCAALGNLLWNWEMTRITGEAQYADLSEWQIYNASAVGLGQDGASYTYNNPLVCEGEINRQAWFKCPCCPSNVSRVWADLGRFVYSVDDGEIWVHQYVGNQVASVQGLGEKGLGIRMESGLPWDGRVRMTLTSEKASGFTFYFRVPSWSDGLRVQVNGESVYGEQRAESGEHPLTLNPSTASGYSPYESYYIPIKRTWSPGDVIELEFKMGIRTRATHPRVKATREKVAVTRGPLVYCLERTDNPEIDIFNVRLDPATLYEEFEPKLLNGITVIRGQTSNRQPLTFIPYFLWANRGDSRMTVYVWTL